ncbi:redoxin domain-containing protein [Microthyrium microscopicum]|uniref:thioredoxin-dependent peroxiredoxin n=1 Tax=Microthyrium microscopicum TaxID=703497 RepID=A0A6A6UIJ9_9PEZI|nr:redoxin domain-containing protein [Microthyrium microscopicum]
MSLTTQLSNVLENFKKNAPEDTKQAIFTANCDFKSNFKPASTIQVGTKIPDFSLPNATGGVTSSADLLQQGPMLISFYRGEWCPFCNLELQALQRHVDEFKAKGVNLVAISPELPDQSLTTVEKHALKFPVLSDVGNKFARQLGIVWAMPDSLRPIFEKFGHGLVTRNGDDSFEVPVPATLLIDQNGVVRNVFLNPDYSKRLEPEEALAWIDAL